MSKDELISYTEKFITGDTICIGASSTFWATDGKKGTSGSNIQEKIQEVILTLREKYPHVKFVLGGHNADFVSTENYKLFDASIIGDAEDNFLELVNSWRDHKSIFHPVTRGGKPFINAVSNKMFNIEHCDHKFVDNDCIIDGEPLPIEISRGCIFKCAFCQYPHIGKTKFDYLRNFDLIKEELEYNYSRWGTTNYYILDDTFNDSDFKMQRWHEITSGLPFKINYSSYLRADLLHRNPHHIDLLRDSGLFSCHIGIETFHPEASRLIGKGWCGKEAKSFLPQLKSKWHDIIIRATFILGIPPETIDDFNSTLEWLIDNKNCAIDSWRFHPLFITPGKRTMSSEFDKNFEKYGFTYDSKTSQWNTPYFDSTSAYNLANEFNEMEKTLIIDNWSAISYLGLGVTKQELLTLSREKITTNLSTFLKKMRLISNYKNRLKNL